MNLLVNNSCLFCRKSTWNLNKPVEVPTAACKIEIDPLADLESEIEPDESTSNVPKIVNVMSLKENVKRESPCASLISKKRKSSDDPDGSKSEQPVSRKQEQPASIKLMIREDFNYKKGPEIAGIKSYFPNVSQYAFLQKFGSAINHFLYVVDDEESWGIASGTLITFQKAALLKLLNMPSSPNILAKKVVSQGPFFDKVRHLAQALFTKGTLLTIQNMEKAVKNQIIAIDNTKSGEHKISIDTLMSVKTVPKSTDSSSHFTLNLNDKGAKFNFQYFWQNINLYWT